MTYRKNRTYLLAIISGLLAALAYSYPSLGFLVFFALVPLFWILPIRSKSQTPISFVAKSVSFKFFLFGFISGLVYFLFIFRWFWTVYPMNSVGIANPFVALALLLLIWLITSVTLSLPWGLFSLGLVWLSRTRSVVRQLLLAAALFTVLEYLRSYLLGLVWYGSGTWLGPHWTLGNPVYALSDNALTLRLSAYLGIYSLDFLLISVNFIVWAVLNHAFISSAHPLPRRKYLPLAAFVLFIILITSIKIPTQISPASGKRLQFAVIQTNQSNAIFSPPDQILADFKKQSELFQTAIKTGADVIIFPEGSNFFKNLSLFLSPAQVRTFFSSLAGKPQLIVDDSRIMITEKTAYSRVVFVDTKTDIAGYYDKKLLTPGGEFLPALPKLLIRLFANTKAQEFESISGFSVGSNEKTAIFENTQFTAALCSDLFSPSLIRDKTDHSDVLIGMASTATFHGSSTIVDQNLAISRFRAAENRIPIILAANDGRSYALNYFGDLEKITPNTDPQILTGDVVLSGYKSWYNRVGDWPIFLVSIAILFIGWTSRKLNPPHQAT